MFGPSSIYSNGTLLFISDLSNNRVLAWSALPTVSGQAASFALGQPGLVSNAANNGGISGSTLFNPAMVSYDGVRLFVADNRNNRVLVWDSIPTVSGQVANFALGQPNLSANSINNGGISGSTMYDPNFVYSDATNLYVSDSANNRILVWNSLPSGSGQSASFALGQPNLSSIFATRDHCAKDSSIPRWRLFSLESFP
jgi:hypothetical protein